MVDGSERHGGGRGQVAVLAAADAGCGVGVYCLQDRLPGFLILARMVRNSGPYEIMVAVTGGQFGVNALPYANYGGEDYTHAACD